MKKFFKFLPVALGVLALASCSDDLMTNSNANADENALYFSIDNSENTRAGMVGDATDAYKTLKFRWTKGDQIRVYDQNLALYDIYQYDGASFDESENKTANKFTNTIDKMLSSYEIGIYPADQVEAVYLDKDDREIKHIEMTLPVEYKYEEATSGKEGYRCDIPMYGNIDNVANSVDNQMNMMTAWTNIYLRNLPADVKYIAVVTENKNLTGIYEAQVSRTAAKNAEPWLKEKVNADPTKFGKMVWSKVNLTDPAALKEKAGISFPLPVADYSGKKISIFGLKDDGLGTTPATIGDNYADWETQVAAGNAINIATREDLKFTKRRQCWQVKYTFTYYLDTDPVDPFRPGEITKVLEAQKDKIVGDFTIVPYSAADGLSPVHPEAAKTLVSGEGDYYTHRIQIPNIKKEQNARIILDFTGAGIQYDEALQIYDMNPETNQFEGKLIIKPGQIKGGSAKAKIEINLPKAEVWVVGDGTHPIGNVDVQNAAAVHIGDGSAVTTQEDSRTVVFKGGKLYIEDKATIKNVYAQAYAGNPAQHAEELIVNPGGYISYTASIQTQCNVTLNGAGYDASASKEYTGVQIGGMASIIKLDCSKVAAPINIKSQGLSRIADLISPTTGDKLNYLNITTKMFQTDENDKSPIGTAAFGDYNTSGQYSVYTGAQLCKAITNDTYLMADEVDMNGVEWTGATLSNNFYGWNHDTDTKTWKKLTGDDNKKTLATKTGKNVIKGLVIKATSTNGLFSNIHAGVTVAGLEFTNPSFTNTTATVMNYTGVVAGTIDATTATLNFTNIKVSGLTVSSKAGSFVGGLVGGVTTAQTAINIRNVDVAATSIAARSFVGGMIGGFEAACTNVNAYDSKATLTGLSLSLADGVSSLQPLRGGTWASFIGGTQGDPEIALSVYDCDFGTAIDKATKGNGINNSGLRFGANADANDVPFFGGNPWIGFCGTVPNSGNPSSHVALNSYKTATTTAADKGKKFFHYSYGNATMTVYRYEGAGNYAPTTQKTLDGTKNATAATKDLPKSVTFNGAAEANKTTSEWISTYAYGTTIYIPYGSAAIGYDATYEPTTFQ